MERKLCGDVTLGVILCFVCFLRNLFLTGRYLFFMLQNIYWSDGGDLVAIASDSSFYVLKYNVSLRQFVAVLLLSNSNRGKLFE